MSRRNPAKRAAVPARSATILDLPKDGLAEFFLNRGWKIHRVIESAANASVEEVAMEARKHGGKVLVVWRAGTTAYVLVPETQRLRKKGKRP